MNAEVFLQALEGIEECNASEGPSRNIFEPKFQARDQAYKLLSTIQNALRESFSLDGQDQAAKVTLFIGLNMHETEEDKDALVWLCRAHEIVRCTIETTKYDFDKLPETDLNQILSTDVGLSQLENEFSRVSTYCEVLNALGVFLSSRDTKQRIEDARKVLHIAERCYAEWNKFFCELGKPQLSDLAIDDHGKLETQRANWAPLDMKLRLTMEKQYTQTLFYLAQVYSIRSDVRNSSKYCHLTMVHQLLTKKEFAKKDWATNALHLSGFFNGEHDFAASMHCLEAARCMMPTEHPDDETSGPVAWAFGKYHKARLRFFTSSERNSAAPQVDVLNKAEWWVDFPLPIPKVAEIAQVPIETFEQARDEFKKANSWFCEALKYYILDGACTDHININRDIADLYLLLAEFESDTARKIAMHERRLEILCPFPAMLNFNSYCTLVRQLYFDLGDIASEILSLRLTQKNAGGPALSTIKLNELCERAQKFFFDFLKTFNEQGKEQMPQSLDRESQTPCFRALMRIASLESKRHHKKPQEEYDTIARTIKRYEDCVAFATKYCSANDEISDELTLAKEMITLLPTKQKDVWRAFHKP